MSVKFSVATECPKADAVVVALQSDAILPAMPDELARAAKAAVSSGFDAKPGAVKVLT